MKILVLFLLTIISINVGAIEALPGETASDGALVPFEANDELLPQHFGNCEKCVELRNRVSSRRSSTVGTLLPGQTIKSSKTEQ